MTSDRRRRGGAQNGDRRAQAQSAAEQEPLAFEEALGRLDETVSALEGGQLPLEEAIRLYEEGVRMAQRCQQMLDTAELRVQQLRAATDDDAADAPFVLEAIEIRTGE